MVSDVAAFLETSLDKAAVDSIAESCTCNSLKAAWDSSDDGLKKHLCRKGSCLVVAENIHYIAGQLRHEGDVKYAVLYFIYVLPTRGNTRFSDKYARS